MKLTIGKQDIALYPDSEISLEKSSPVLNDKVGSFSYPFPIPTKPNQMILGWPGDLHRTGNLPVKSFILEDQGIQILNGEIEYDAITREDTGIILTSGITEFYGKLESLEENASLLSNIIYGNEFWFGPGLVNYNDFAAKLLLWDSYNDTEEYHISLAPFQFREPDTELKFGNKHNDQGHLTQPISDVGNYYIYGHQFRAWWVLEKIFENFGYSVISDELREGDFKGLVILGRPFRITLQTPNPTNWPSAGPFDVLVDPPMANMEYSYFMPQVKIVDFLEAMRVYMGLVYLIDDLKKEVNITTLKSLLTPIDSTIELKELSGWEHREGKPASKGYNGGYSVSYMSQDDPLDNRGDYSIYANAASRGNMPYVNIIPSGQVVHAILENRDYIQKFDEATQQYWNQIGRLKPTVSGIESTKIVFNVKVPASDYTSYMFKGPMLSLSFTEYLNSLYIYDMKDIYVSIYRGMVTNFVMTNIPYQTVPVPYMSGDKWNTSQTVYLSTEALINAVYTEYLAWQNSNPRSFVKYLQMTLPEVIALKWSTVYFAGGVKVILSKINYELPFTGIVKVEGYVA